MSYDIDLEMPETCDCAEHNPDTSFVVYTWNYTSNCAPMWREAGADLAEFDGRPVAAVRPILRAAIERMEADPERFEAMNPPNGWGDLESLLQNLRGLLHAMHLHPTATVGVSR